MHFFNTVDANFSLLELIQETRHDVMWLVTDIRRIILRNMWGFVQVPIRFDQYRIQYADVRLMKNAKKNRIMVSEN